MNELSKNSHKKAAWLFFLVAACMLMSNIAAATGSHWQKKCNVNKCDNALSMPLLIENGKRVGKVTVRYQNNRLKVEYQTLVQKVYALLGAQHFHESLVCGYTVHEMNQPLQKMARCTPLVL